MPRVAQSRERETEQYCRAYAYRAEIKMGQMLKAAQDAGVLAKRGRPNKSIHKEHLANAGVTRKESAEAQMLASLPEEKREAVIGG